MTQSERKATPQFDTDPWARWRGWPGRLCVLTVAAVDGHTIKFRIAEVAAEIDPEQADLTLPTDSVPEDWWPLRRGDVVTAHLHRLGGPWPGFSVTWAYRITPE